MTEHWSRDVAHVIGRDEVAAANRRQSFGAQQERHRGARTRTIVSGGVIARAADDVHYIALHARLDPHISYFRATARNSIRVRERLDLDLIKAARIETRIPPRHHLMFLISRRIRE